MAVLGLYGPADASFLRVSAGYKTFFKQKALVTGTDKNTLKTINNMSAAKFMEDTGLVAEGKSAALELMPLVFFTPDGEIVTRACVGAAPDGGLILMGAAPERSTVAFSAVSMDSILRSAEEKIWEAMAIANGRSILIYSCVSRFWSLGLDGTGEHRKASECIGRSAPYHLVYSGGEIYPSRKDDGTSENLLLNDSLIICVL
jgi:hypothetical protein